MNYINLVWIIIYYILNNFFQYFNSLEFHFIILP